MGNISRLTGHTGPHIHTHTQPAIFRWSMTVRIKTYPNVILLVCGWIGLDCVMIWDIHRDIIRRKIDVTTAPFGMSCNRARAHYPRKKKTTAKINLKIPLLSSVVEHALNVPKKNHHYPRISDWRSASMRFEVVKTSVLCARCLDMKPRSINTTVLVNKHGNIFYIISIQFGLYVYNVDSSGRVVAWKPSHSKRERALLPQGTSRWLLIHRDLLHIHHQSVSLPFLGMPICWQYWTTMHPPGYLLYVHLTWVRRAFRPSLTIDIIFPFLWVSVVQCFNGFLHPFLYPSSIYICICIHWSDPLVHYLALPMHNISSALHFARAPIRVYDECIYHLRPPNSIVIAPKCVSKGPLGSRASSHLINGNAFQ